MSKINLDIKDYIHKLSQQGLTVKFCHGFKPLKQRGQTCKLVGGAAVQHYLVHVGRHSSVSLPLYKNRLYSESLRQRAKQVINSQAGEVYGPEQVAKVFNYNDFKTTSYYISEQQHYKNLILAALNQEQPVLVYFDVNPRKKKATLGEPSKVNGEFEHCAVITGYYQQNDQLRLIAAQWGELFDISFAALFASTSQLKSVKEPEHYQKYYPIPGFFKQKTWLEKEQMNLAIKHMATGKPWLEKILVWLNHFWPKNKEERVSSPPKGNQACLANVLTIIQGNLKEVNLSDFSDFEIHSSNSSQLEEINDNSLTIS
ncbi:hypothetical protein ACNVED_11930 [Legionella sp. D16C41]|uniref:hypothetical protein n=1 Tax=Legionella sp. D16C41 TaxID=3402688 RepID=UPI003AF86898